MTGTDSAKLYEKLGVKRIVTARELSFSTGCLSGLCFCVPASSAGTGKWQISAQRRTASPKPQPSFSCTKRKTSPPAPQLKQWYTLFAGSTRSEG
ncbi:hypothetical protein [Parabacteroides goldsteinii]|uniref:hypothetical protein n=1 Tax=Parabacteroides goldsteinii TaxID=328812 RepID=UPI00338E9BA6